MCDAAGVEDDHGAALVDEANTTMNGIVINLRAGIRRGLADHGNAVADLRQAVAPMERATRA
ncbi:MAG: hypothetical protein JNK45_10610 [Myxococcales bacterium]|nr:hypothetical protein [Myxococcales bacterium]